MNIISNLVNKISEIFKAKKQDLAAPIGRSPYSTLCIMTDNAGWVLDYEAEEMLGILEKINIPAFIDSTLDVNIQQCVHYTTRYVMLDPATYKTKHRLSFDYFHGLPENGESFVECYRALRQYHKRIYRIRVSQSQIEQLVLSSGIDPLKVHRIPIGINLAYFRPQTNELKVAARKELGIPDNAMVIGSFQKDGNGWGEGLEPKLIKGPDIFLKSVEVLKQEYPEIWVLLTGPARGYVKQGLEKLGIPYIHRFLQDYSQIGSYYHALDLYIIASREEGGPKAVLESMASGIPLITTRVGQAMDFVSHGVNGWMVDIEDYEGLAYWAQFALEDTKLRESVIEEACKTAKANTYDRQLELWRAFFLGYVES